MDKVMSDRKRGKNISEKDKCLLVELMKMHASDIECKKHDVKMLDKKRNAWIRVCNEFNAASDGKKNEDQLKILWKDLKAKAKKQKATSSREMIKTGGGPQETHVDDISKVIIATIPQMFDAIDGVCDDDVAMSNLSGNASAEESLHVLSDVTHEEEENEGNDETQCYINIPARIETDIPTANPQKYPGILRRERRKPVNAVNEKHEELHETRLKYLRREHEEKMSLIIREREMQEEAHALRMEVLRALRNKIVNQPNTSTENLVTFVDDSELCEIVITDSNDS